MFMAIIEHVILRLSLSATRMKTTFMDNLRQSLIFWASTAYVNGLAPNRALPGEPRTKNKRSILSSTDSSANERP